jgi:hypothetical protein
MTDIISINSSNQVSVNSTSFRVNFSTAVNPSNSEIALSKLILYNAIANIRVELSNTSLSYTWPDAAGVWTTYTIDLLPSGIRGIYAGIEDINGIMQTVMFNNGHYLINSSGIPIYYISLAAVTYANRFAITNSVLPTALPSGFTKPTTGTFASWIFPASAGTPQLIIPSTAIQTNLGFNAGSYPSTNQATANISVSQNTPLITDITSLVVRCNFIGYSQFSNIHQRLASVPIDAGYNSYINYTPPQLSWVRTAEGSYRSIDVTICDQNGNELTSLLDTSGIVMEIQLRKTV